MRSNLIMDAELLGGVWASLSQLLQALGICLYSRGEFLYGVIWK